MLISLSQVRSSGVSGWLASLYFKYLYWNWKYTNTKYWNNPGNIEPEVEGGAVGADSEDKHFPLMNRLHNYRKCFHN